MQERADQIAEWIALAEEKRAILSQVAKKPEAGRPEGGVNAAARDLGLVKAEAHRAVKIASTSDEAKDRAELTPADRAKYTARRKALYLELYPETRHGGDRRSDQVAELATCSFAEATAAAKGRSERIIQLDAERGKKVSEGLLPFGQ